MTHKKTHTQPTLLFHLMGGPLDGSTLRGGRRPPLNCVTAQDSAENWAYLILADPPCVYGYHTRQGKMTVNAVKNIEEFKFSFVGVPH